MSCYNRALVEHILPAVWDAEAAYGLKAELVPDADMPRGHKDPKKGSPLFAHIADIKQAWKRTDLTTVERQSIVLRYGLDYGYEEIADARGVRKQSAQEATERAVGKVTAWLNGDKYIDGYDQLEVEE
ncbi:DNA binding protein [Streptomyces phage Amethyst]|uniref:DNA binding protein n=1 Tax=Streptomyces phage Amethyst TaxID=2041205 RepID=A0A291LH31_9CAUD|nr:sigma factor [Streptomyces phage Amethyst]ATI18667.1 DNA binding protein [Streptomyces phage Amethyst]